MIYQTVELEDYDLAKYQALNAVKNRSKAKHVQFNYDLIRFTPPSANVLVERLKTLDPKFTVAREEIVREIQRQTAFH